VAGAAASAFRVGATRADWTALAWDVVRFFLAFEMIRYGMAKIVGMQFYPQYWRLDQRALEMAPMSLAWTFFGRTYGYQAVGGLIEVVSGTLVAFRRTTLLGACLMATALVNVVLVDFFYDVPVKLFASLYLFMDIALVAREGRRLRALFLPLPREDHPPRARVIRGVLVVFVLVLPTAEIVREAMRHGVFHTDALEGVWTVEQQTGLERALPDAAGSWDRVYFEKGDFGFVRAGQKRVRFDLRVNESARTLNLAPRGTTPVEGVFDLRDRRLRVAGEHDGTPFSLDLRREFPE
jgi:hypothetical protein